MMRGKLVREREGMETEERGEESRGGEDGRGEKKRASLQCACDEVSEIARQFQINHSQIARKPIENSAHC